MQALDEAWQFGRFQLEPNRRLLLADGEPVTLSSRAYDILELLVRCHDRVVTRDEIVSHVWRGVTVGENNLAVQMSNLRRVLGEHADGQPLIVNVSGRGYRLVAEVREPDQPLRIADAMTPLQGDFGVVSPPSQNRTRPDWRRRYSVIIAATVLFGSVGAAAVAEYSAGWIRLSRPALDSGLLDPRLTIAVRRFEAIGDDPRTAVLATRYREALLARFAQFEELRLFPDSEHGPDELSPRFELTGSVQIEGANVILTISLLQRPSHQLIYKSNEVRPATATFAEQSESALQVLTELRPVLFHAEALLQKGGKKDATDLIVAAHDVLGTARQREPLRRAIAMTEEAVRLSPADRPARSFLGFLLAFDMMSQSAALGDAEGWRALAITDGVLREQPQNPLYLYRRTYILTALGCLQDAQATAERGLRIEPEDALLRVKLGEIQIMKGNIDAGKALLKPDPSDAQDDTAATIAFAEARYADSLDLIVPVVRGTPAEDYTSADIILEIATLAQLGRVQEARSLLLSELSIIPKDLRVISAQRQTLYVLPNNAWKQFKSGLLTAGMQP